jgi:hypothetical protein
VRAGIRAGVVLDITMEYFNYPSGVFGGMTTSSNFKVLTIFRRVSSQRGNFRRRSANLDERMDVGTYRELAC